MFAKPLYLKHYGYLLDDPDIFQIFFPGTHRSTRESKHNDVIVISGKKGSGKTELAKFIAYVYHEKLPRNRVIIFSGIKDLYNDLPWAIKVDLKEVEQEEQEKSRGDYSGIPDASEFRDSLVIFDDTEKMPNVKIEKMLYQLRMCSRRTEEILGQMSYVSFTKSTKDCKALHCYEKQIPS
jgi:energy-coupling factor transporter ATP-binding protein EcfA2